MCLDSFFSFSKSRFSRSFVLTDLHLVKHDPESADDNYAFDNPAFKGNFKMKLSLIEKVH